MEPQTSTPAKRPRGWHLTSEHQRMARSHVKPESLRRAGKRGYQACADRHGKDFAAIRVADYRRHNPSSLEKIVIQWLDDAGFPYSREVEFDGQYVDFLVAGELAIECDSNWHTLPGRTEADARKELTLAKYGVTLLRLTTPAIESGDAHAEIMRVLRDIQSVVEL